MGSFWPRTSAVDGGDAGLDELCRVHAGGGVHGQAVDVHAGVGQDLRATVDGATQAVEHAPKHVLRDAKLHGAAQEADLAVGEVDARGVLEELDHDVGAVDLKHLAATNLAVGELNLAKLVVGDALDALHEHKGAGDLLDGAILSCH